MENTMTAKEFERKCIALIMAEDDQGFGELVRQHTSLAEEIVKKTELECKDEVLEENILQRIQRQIEKVIENKWGF